MRDKLSSESEQQRQQSTQSQAALTAPFKAMVPSYV